LELWLDDVLASPTATAEHVRSVLGPPMVVFTAATDDRLAAGT
jgi:hypothetical protein